MSKVIEVKISIKPAIFIKTTLRLWSIALVMAASAYALQDVITTVTKE